MVSPISMAKRERDGRNTVKRDLEKNMSNKTETENRKGRQGSGRDRKIYPAGDGVSPACCCSHSEEGRGDCLHSCGQCGRSFHLSCLGMQEAPKIDPWTCPHCQQINKDAGKTNNAMPIFMGLPVPEPPVDFQIPYSLKRKAHHYIYIKRNFYLTKKKRVEDDGVQCSCGLSSSSPERVCDENCHCGMINFSCSSSCDCGESCINKPFQLRQVKKLKRSKTEKCGWGLKADEEIMAGEFLIEYVGEVIDDKTCEERLWKMKERGETNFYLLEITREMVIDATYKANKSRFINHSCRPNTELQKWKNDGETRVGVFAKKNIRKGEFITYDYQWIQFGTDQQCYCGAPDCRRILGAKPSKQKKSSDAAMKIVTQEVILPRSLKNLLLYANLNAKDKSREGFGKELLLHKKNKPASRCLNLRVRVWCPEDQRFYCGRIVNFDPIINKHTILYDDGDKEALVMSEEKWDFDIIPPIQRKQLVTNGSVDSFVDSISAETVE